MSIWLILLAVVVVGGAFWFLNRKGSNSAETTVNEVKEEVKQALDVNHDGKVNVEDAKAAVEVVKTKTKAAAGKAKTAVKAASAKAKSTSKTKK